MTKPSGKAKQNLLGTWVQIDDFKSNYVSSARMTIFFPPGYDSLKQYAVLYMYDGQMLFDSTNTWNHQEWGVDETVSALLSKNQIPPLIVVGIWNNGSSRHSQYFPQKPFESLPQKFRDSLLNLATRKGGTQLFAKDVYSDAYLKCIVEEIKPFIDKRFSTYTDPKHTFISGSSMGGLISLYAICEYPEVFGGAACLSTHWTGTFETQNNPIPQAFFDYLEKQLPSPENHRIYFDYGTETLDALYEPFQKSVDEIMKQKGYGPNTWQTLKFEGADHSEQAWRARFSIPLIFLTK